METGDKIRDLRKQRNWSQKDMAEKLEMSVNGYSKIERGETEPPLHRLNQISDALGVPIRELLPNNEGGIIFMINEGDNYQTYQSHSSQKLHELEAENQNLKLIIQHKEEIIANQQRELAQMQEILALLKQHLSKQS